MKKTIKNLLLSLAAVLAAVSASAQITTSSMNGKVADSNGSAIPGVAVVAVHTPSGTQYFAVTNSEGAFYINGMRAGGPYTVEASCLGYKNVTYTDVTLQLAEATALNFTMPDDSEVLAEAVVISNALSKFSTEKTGAATNINNAQIVNLPTVSREITDVTRLSPYGGNGMTFAGADGRTANFTVDGANFNNNFGLSSNLPGGGNPISIDAIEELQVVISPFDVRQTNFIGGGVNAITKSGTNTFKGSAYVYHRNENMRGDTVADTQITTARETDRNTTYGFTLGGPIVKNKLFFFVNAEYSKSPSQAVTWRASKDGVGDEKKYLSYATEDDLRTVSDFVKSKYGYDTGSFTEFPADQSNVKVLARIDWNINSKNHLAIRYNYTNNTAWNAPNASSMDGGTRAAFGRTSLYGMSYANSMYSMNNLVHTATLDLNSRISDKLSNQLLATFSKLDDVRGTNSTPFPFVDIMDGTFTNTPYISLGYELFTWNNAVHNTVANVKDDLTYYAGNHKITAGVNYEYQMADNAYMRNGSGYYRYKSVNDFLNGSTPEVVCMTYGYDGEPNPAARVTFHKAGIYAQDEWAITPKFKLTYGLRLDGLFFDNSDIMTNQAIYDLEYPDADGNIRHVDTGKWPNSKLTVSPRIGFNWDVLGDKSLKVRGGTGFFSGRLPLVFFTNMPTNSGMVQCNAKYGPSGTSTDMTVFNGGLLMMDELQKKLISIGSPATISPDKGTVGSSFCGVDAGFKMPQVWKTTLAIDYAFPTPFPFSVSVEGIFNKTINGVCLSDWSIMPVGGFTRFNGADDRPLYQGYTGKYSYINAKGKETGMPNAFMLSNTNKGYGYSFVASMNMRPIDAISLMFAYTRTGSKELTGMPGSDASSAFTYIPTSEGPNNVKLHNSQYVTPDRMVASATIHDKSHNHYSFIYEAWRGGYNYSYMTANDMNGDGYNYDAIYIPTDQQVKNNEFRFVSAADATRFLDYVHNDKYLSKHQGEYAEGYSVYSPWVHRLDFSYKHDFQVKCGNNTNTLQLSLDVKNLLNIFNPAWGVSKIMNSKLSSGRILKYEGADAEGYATFSTPKDVNGSIETWLPSYSVGQCWYASVGIKYMFN